MNVCETVINNPLLMKLMTSCPNDRKKGNGRLIIIMTHVILCSIITIVAFVFVLFWFYFEIQIPSVSHVELVLTKQNKLALNMWLSFCVSSPCARIAGISHYVHLKTATVKDVFISRKFISSIQEHQAYSPKLSVVANS